MRRQILSVLLFSFAASAALAGSGNHSMSVSTHGGSPAGCSDLDVTIEHRAALRAEQVLTIAAPAGSALRIQAAPNSGVYVEASDRRDVLVLACKAARTPEDLAGIRLRFENGVLTATGPDEEPWIASLLVQVPRSAALDLDASNGPLSLRGLTGRVTAQTRNGPIQVKDCPGDIEARAQNGPIQLSGSGGNVRVETQNGPISVKLTGSSWAGPGLEARAQNGPLSLRIPDGYQSGAVVESAGHSPFRCKGGACDRARRLGGDDGRRVELGAGAPVVRLSTVNGPVSIASADADVED